MKELLTNIGISNLNSLIYEYSPVKLDWWDSQNYITIEVEIHQNNEEVNELSVIFSPEIQGVIERTVIFATHYKSDCLNSHGLVDKKVCEQLMPENTFNFFIKKNSYIIDSLKDIKEVFAKISDFIVNKKPINIVDLKQIIEKEDDTTPEVGESLSHFITMMNMNSSEFTRENIIDTIELGLKFEGDEYLTKLKNAITSEGISYDVDDKTLKLIKETIRNYKW